MQMISDFMHLVTIMLRQKYAIWKVDGYNIRSVYTGDSRYVDIGYLDTITKRQRGGAVSTLDFRSRGRGFESRWMRDSSRT